DTVDFLVGQVAGVDLRPPRFSIGAAGTAVVFAHTLTNLGNGPDSFTVTAVSVRGWPVTLYRDWDGDGLLGAGDSLLTGPVPLAPGSAAALLARVAIPGAASPGRSGAPLTDAGGDDDGYIAPAGNGVVVVDFGALAPGATGSVTFQVQVNPGPARTVDNRSNVTFNAGGASDTTLSNTVRTNVLV